MAKSDIRWEGLKTMEVMCDILPDRIAKARLSEAYKYALEPTKTAMQTNVGRAGTGRLWHSIDSTIVGMGGMHQTYGIVGPRRKRGVWNMQGWHAHLVENKVKAHNIRSLKPIPMYKNGVLMGFTKTIKHPGYAGRKPFTLAMDRTWRDVGERVSAKVSEIMSNEIEVIKRQYSDL